MNIDRHVRRFHPITLGFLTVVAVVELIIAAWLQAHYNSHHNYPSISVRDRNAFLIFTSSWTIVFSILFGTLFMHSASSGSALTSVASHFLVFFLTWVFWLAGAASITSSLGGGVNCSASDLVYCNQLMALMAFAWIAWATVSIFLLVILLLGVRALRSGAGYRGQLVTTAAY